MSLAFSSDVPLATRTGWQPLEDDAVGTVVVVVKAMFCGRPAP
jgi:hypothetical protein